MAWPGRPTSTTHAGACTVQGRGAKPVSFNPTELSVSAQGLTKCSSKRGGKPCACRTWLAMRKASAGPAQSSTRLCGSRANSTWMGGVKPGGPVLLEASGRLINVPPVVHLAGRTLGQRLPCKACHQVQAHVHSCTDARRGHQRPVVNPARAVNHRERWKACAQIGHVFPVGG